MKRIIALVLALVASTAVGAAVQIPLRNASGGGIDIKGSTDGSSAASGNVGEYYSDTGGALTALVGTAYVTLDSFTLPAGGTFLVWASYSNVKLTANSGYLFAMLSQNSGGYTDLTQAQSRLTEASSDTFTTASPTILAIVSVASTATSAQRTIAARMQCTATCTGFAQATMQYVRIR